jgi:hypothetical protein
MTLEELANHRQLRIHFNQQVITADLVVEPVTGDLFFQITSQTFPHHQDQLKTRITPDLAQRIHLAADGLPQLDNE